VKCFNKLKLIAQSTVLVKCWLQGVIIADELQYLI